MIENNVKGNIRSKMNKLWISEELHDMYDKTNTFNFIKAVVETLEKDWQS